eukprot:5754140-Pyramimonas_sp.AAC.1
MKSKFRNAGERYTYVTPRETCWQGDVDLSVTLHRTWKCGRGGLEHTELALRRLVTATVLGSRGGGVSSRRTREYLTELLAWFNQAFSPYPLTAIGCKGDPL